MAHIGQECAFGTVGIIGQAPFMAQSSLNVVTGFDFALSRNEQENQYRQPR